MIKYKKPRRGRYVTCMGEMRNAFNGLIEKSEGKRPLGKRRSMLLESILIMVGGDEFMLFKARTSWWIV
jgi:hypothetical protein